MSTMRTLPGGRVARAMAATAAAGTLTFFVGLATAQADVSGSAAPNGSAAVPAQPQVTVVTTTTAATATDTATVTDTATSSAANNCPATVVIVLSSITVSGGQVTVSFSHTGTECPDAAPSVLHVHENLLSAPHAGSDPVHQLNQNFNIGPDFGDSVTVPLLDAVEGKCFVQVDAHASGVNRGQFFPTATCPSSSPSQSVSPSQSTSPSQVVNPPSPPAGPSSSSKAVVPPVSSPTALTNQEGPVLASTGVKAQNPLLLGASLLLAGAMLLAAGLPGRRWRTGIRAARTIWAGGRH
jgi:hypothetical protein